MNDKVVSLSNDGANLILGVLIFFGIGALWMIFYWRVLDPWARRILGQALGVHINLGQSSIWQINQESVDSTNWRNLIVRPVQMLLLMMGGLVPFVATLVVIGALMG
jgi:hypothetical protein